MKEKTIEKAVMLTLSQAGCTVWRNATARAWVGKWKGQTRDGDAVIEGARQVRFGLAEGSSDIIGIAPDGRFLAVEVKAAGGRESKAQARFREAVNATGGVAFVARSGEEALEKVREAVDG